MAPSTLNRYMLRQIARNRPIAHDALAQRARCASTFTSDRNFHDRPFLERTLARKYSHISPILLGRVNGPIFQRRSAWWLPTPAKTRYIKPQDVTPGLTKLRKSHELLKLQMRTPALADMVAPLRQFLQHKCREGQKLLDTEAEPALAVFEHVRAATPAKGVLQLDLEKQIAPLFDILTPPEASQDNEIFLRLASLVHDDVLKQISAFTKSSDEANKASYDEKTTFLNLAHRSYIKLLAQCGEGAKAREIVEEQIRNGRKHFNDTQYWGYVVKAFARARNDDEIRRTISAMRGHKIKYYPYVQLQVISSYVDQLNMSAIKLWYEEPLDESKPLSATQLRILEACIATKDFVYGKRISEALVLDDLGKAQWDVVLRWVFASGRGIDEVDRLMRLMVEKGPRKKTDVQPDIDTLNGLLKYANERGDAYSAERLMRLAESWKLSPNANTLMLQMEYRLRERDIDGAKTTYQALRGHELSNNEDVPLMNRLVRESCQAERADEEQIMSYVQDIEDKRALLEPETVATLCVYHLKRQEFDDAIELLNSIVFRFQAEQRSLVRDVLLSFTLDETTSTEDAWDAYCIMKETFDSELNNTSRLRIMKHFFERNNCEGAVHVFGNMRQAVDTDIRPDARIYAECFKGIAKSQSEVSLNTVHNMLKLDSEVEPTTDLNNALMVAHFECGSPRRALEVWNTIALSGEGPSIRSVILALGFCQFAPAGEEHARAVWAQIDKLRVPKSKPIYDAYVAALAARDNLRNAIESIEEMQRVVGVAPDAVTIGGLCNGPTRPEVMKKCIVWANSTHPQVWQELKKIGLSKEGKFRVGFYDRDTPVPFIVDA